MVTALASAQISLKLQRHYPAKRGASPVIMDGAKPRTAPPPTGLVRWVKNYGLWLLLTGIFFIPSLFSGGRGNLAAFLYFVFICAILIFFKDNFSLQKSPTAVAIIIFILWIFVGFFTFSITSLSSLKLFFPLLAGAIIFLSGWPSLSRERLAESLLLVAAMLAFIGIVFFLFSQNFTYLRLSSTFYNHNGFSGFLIVPTLLSLWLFWREKEWGHILTFFLAVLFVTALILTFSRGGMLSLAIAILIYLCIITRAIGFRKDFFKKLGALLIVLLFSAAFAYAIFWFKGIQAGGDNVDKVSQQTINAPYEVQDPEDSAIVARVHYMSAAYRAFVEKPITGFGWGSYGAKARQLQTDFRFFSIDPHNLYLRVLAETGLIGGILFAVFIISILVSGVLYQWKNPQDILAGSFLAGFIGMLAHNAIDLDFQFPANVILFFTIASVVARQKTSETKNGWRVVTIISFVALLVLLLFALGDAAQARAKEALVRQDEAGFWYWQRFSFINPLSSDTKFHEASLYYSNGDYDRAREILEDATRRNPGDRNAYLLQGAVYQKLKMLGEAESAYRRAQELAPHMDLEATFGLADVLLSQGKKEEARAEAQEALERFPSNKMQSGIWTNPTRERIVKQRKALEEFLNKGN